MKSVSKEIGQVTYTYTETNGVGKLICDYGDNTDVYYYSDIDSLRVHETNSRLVSVWFELSVEYDNLDN